MINFTKYTLGKVESLLEDQGYIVRYEKGTFTSGYCILEHRKVAVLNKFYDTEARINCLLDILISVDVDESLFGVKNKAFYRQAMKHLLQNPEPVV
ncbi:MAG: hypothetical protein KJP00_14750 [Bacteroidia bacterium]|nr:hypothetical protein [Bacteroidia bacterium]